MFKLHFAETQEDCKRKSRLQMQTARFLNFLRGEIESGYSSIQNLLYRRNVCKVCTVSKRKRKNIKKY